MICWICQYHCLIKGLFSQHIAKKSIVRTHEKPITSMDCNWSAPTAHTGINNTDKDRSWRKVAIARGQNPRTRGNLLWCNIVRNVDNLSVRNNTKYDSFQHTDIT